MREYLRTFVKQLPFVRKYFTRKKIYIQGLLDQIDAFDQKISQSENGLVPILWPPGHYHSPIVSVEEIRKNEERVFHISDRVPGVDLNETTQLTVLDELAEFYETMPFLPEKSPNGRYFFENEMYSYSDGIVLYSMIRRLKPPKIVEIGSGFSSCVILDTNDAFFDGNIRCTFIEPYPDRLLDLLTPDDLNRINLIRSRLQDVGQGVFDELESGDILFIDSSHVAKTGSDVNHVFGRILPSLAAGVHVHFHDIFYPFEYPKEWVYEGRSWNEIYILRAFLQHNSVFSIQYFADFIAKCYREKLSSSMPLCLRNTGGNLWLRKET